MNFDLRAEDRLELIVSVTMSILRVENTLERLGPDSMFYRFYFEQRIRLENLLRRLQEVYEDEKLS